MQPPVRPPTLQSWVICIRIEYSGTVSHDYSSLLTLKLMLVMSCINYSWPLYLPTLARGKGRPEASYHGVYAIPDPTIYRLSMQTRGGGGRVHNARINGHVNL